MKIQLALFGSKIVGLLVWAFAVAAITAWAFQWFWNNYWNPSKPLSYWDAFLLFLVIKVLLASCGAAFFTGCVVC